MLGGFDTETVFLTAVRGINGLRNISAEYENTPQENASFADYKEALSLIEKLRGQGLLDMELGGKQTDYSSPHHDRRLDAPFKGCLLLRSDHVRKR